MGRQIQGKDGKFKGSIGNGKTIIPTPSTLLPSDDPETAENDEPDYDSLYTTYSTNAQKNRDTRRGNRMRTQGNKVLFNRLGGLNSYPQEVWDRAPQAHGTWAFPWPAFEMFFAYHQYDHVMPKLLRRGNKIPYAAKEAYLLDGEPATRLPTEEEFYAEDSLWECREELWQMKDDWVKNVGQKTWKMRDFWYSGNLYTHIRPNGDIMSLSDWVLMPARNYAEAVRRSGYLDTFYRDFNGSLYKTRYAADHLEVFLADKI